MPWWCLCPGKNGSQVLHHLAPSCAILCHLALSVAMKAWIESPHYCIVTEAQGCWSNVLTSPPPDVFAPSCALLCRLVPFCVVSLDFWQSQDQIFGGLKSPPPFQSVENNHWQNWGARACFPPFFLLGRKNSLCLWLQYLMPNVDKANRKRKRQILLYACKKE